MKRKVAPGGWCQSMSSSFAKLGVNPSTPPRDPILVLHAMAVQPFTAQHRSYIKVSTTQRAGPQAEKGVALSETIPECPAGTVRLVHRQKSLAIKVRSPMPSSPCKVLKLATLAELSRFECSLSETETSETPEL